MDILISIVEPIYKLIPKLPGLLLNLFVGIIMINVVMFAIKRAVKLLRLPHDLRGFVITGIKMLSWLVLTIFIISSLGFGNLAVMLSGSAVILAFVLNNSAGSFLGDVFAGLFLISDPDFTVGMKVSTNEGKTEGIIKGIDMRKVRILDAKNKLHIVPNSMIEKGEWVVLERKAKK
jgi:small-conductance mechanosensitive channel